MQSDKASQLQVRLKLSRAGELNHERDLPAKRQGQFQSVFPQKVNTEQGAAVGPNARTAGIAPLSASLCSLKGFCALNKSKKFKLSLVALIVCIIGFQFSTPSINFYTNPFYIGSFIFAIALLVIAVNFTCPNCRKNQVALSLKQFRLPSNTCCNCGYSVGKNGTE